MFCLLKGICHWFCSKTNSVCGLFCLTVLSHELVKLGQHLSVFRRWLTLLRTEPTLLWVRGWRLTAVAAHEGWKNSRIVHAPIQSPKQRPNSLCDNVWVVAAISICSFFPGLHLQLLPCSLFVHVLIGRHADCVLPAVAEVTVLMLMVLQEVVDRPQPQSGAWTRASAASAGTLAMPIAATVAATPTAIRVHLFTPFTVQRMRNNNKKVSKD